MPKSCSQVGGAARIEPRSVDDTPRSGLVCAGHVRGFCPAHTSCLGRRATTAAPPLCPSTGMSPFWARPPSQEPHLGAEGSHTGPSSCSRSGWAPLQLDSDPRSCRGAALAPSPEPGARLRRPHNCTRGPRPEAAGWAERAPGAGPLDGKEGPAGRPRPGARDPAVSTMVSLSGLGLSI